MIEFWAVATRPSSANGFGWSVLQTCQEVAVMAVHFVMLSDTPDIYDMWKNIVSACGITGKRVHDARLAAVSEVHQCDAVLTFNIADFISIRQIKLLDPAQIGSWPLAFTV